MVRAGFRLLAVIVAKEGAQVSADELRAFLEPNFAKWWLPDAIVFTKEIARTATGKFSKLTLREQYANYRPPPGVLPAYARWGSIGSMHGRRVAPVVELGLVGAPRVHEGRAPLPLHLDDVRRAVQGDLLAPRAPDPAGGPRERVGVRVGSRGGPPSPAMRLGIKTSHPYPPRTGSPSPRRREQNASISASFSSRWTAVMPRCGMWFGRPSGACHESRDP